MMLSFHFNGVLIRPLPLLLAIATTPSFEILSLVGLPIQYISCKCLYISSSLGVSSIQQFGQECKFGHRACCDSHWLGAVSFLSSNRSPNNRVLTSLCVSHSHNGSCCQSSTDEDGSSDRRWHPSNYGLLNEVWHEKVRWICVIRRIQRLPHTTTYRTCIIHG